MNYTKWIQDNHPALADASSAEIYALIRRAKQSCLAWILLARLSLIFLAIVSVDYLAPVFGSEPFQGFYSWLLFVVVLAVAAILGEKAEHSIVTYKIRKIVSAS